MSIREGVAVSYKQEIFAGVHRDTDNYKLALYTRSAMLDAHTTHYTEDGEVQGDGYEAGGQSLDGFKVSKIVSDPVSVRIERDGEMAVVSHHNHGFQNGQIVTISNAIQDGYNLTTPIKVLDSFSYLYRPVGLPSTPATGYPVVTVDLVVLAFSDVSWPQATFTAAGALIYNASKGNQAVCVLDFDGDKTSTAGTFYVKMPEAERAIIQFS